MTGKLKRRQWHNENRTFVYNYFQGVCQKCYNHINITDKFDIHHLVYNYKGKLYDTLALELIQNNVITLLCRKCHDDIHTAKDNKNPQQLENKTNCEICGKIEKGIFDRKKTQKLDKLLCKKCFNDIKYGIIQTTLF